MLPQHCDSHGNSPLDYRSGKEATPSTLTPQEQQKATNLAPRAASSPKSPHPALLRDTVTKKKAAFPAKGVQLKASGYILIQFCKKTEVSLTLGRAISFSLLLQEHLTTFKLTVPSYAQEKASLVTAGFKV